MKLIIKVLIFVNRLSDYFFALARVINYRKHCEDIPYERGAKVFHNITKADVERWAKKIITRIKALPLIKK